MEVFEQTNSWALIFLIITLNLPCFIWKVDFMLIDAQPDFANALSINWILQSRIIAPWCA